MRFRLPAGWSTERVDEMLVTVRCPPEIVGNMRRAGSFSIFGARNDRQVEEVLRVMLPAYGVPYPATEQLSLL